MNEGVNGLLAGVDLQDVVPESVVKIPAGRLIGSQLISGLLWLVFFGVIFAIAIGSTLIGVLIDGDPDGGIVLLGIGLGMGVPMLIAVVGITWAQISKSLRYSIAPPPTACASPTDCSPPSPRPSRPAVSSRSRCRSPCSGGRSAGGPSRSTE